MGLKVEINTSSYAMVADELGKTLQQATNVFETFLSERHNLSLLEQCEANLRQVGGTLRLLQIPGGALLADEMRALCSAILKALLPFQKVNSMPSVRRSLYCLDI